MLKEPNLIFIISQPRSGSTLLQKIVSNNSYVDTASEPWLLLPLLSIYKPELVEAVYNYPVAATGIVDFLEKRGLEDRFKSSVANLVLSLYTNNSQRYFLDKTPRYYEILPEIFSVFPDAKYIVLKRNPFASLYSMLSTWSNGKLDIQSIEKFYRDFLIAPFRIQDFLDKNSKLDNVLEVGYELLVQKPVELANNIYQWLSIPFDEEVLCLAKNQKVSGIYGDDVYKEYVSDKVESNSLEVWMRECDKEPLKSFFKDYADYLSPNFLTHYGYDTVPWRKSLFTKNNIFEKLISRLDIELK